MKLKLRDTGNLTFFVQECVRSGLIADLRSKSVHIDQITLGQLGTYKDPRRTNIPPNTTSPLQRTIYLSRRGHLVVQWAGSRGIRKRKAGFRKHHASVFAPDNTDFEPEGILNHLPKTSFKMPYFIEPYCMGDLIKRFELRSANFLAVQPGPAVICSLANFSPLYFPCAKGN